MFNEIGIAVADLKRSREKLYLALMLGWQDIRQRYRRSTLGPFWLTISMGVMIGMIGIVFGGSAALALGVKDWGSFSLPGNLSVWLLLGAIVLYALSWRLSIRLYRSREL